ncbi:hypothetical protein [uncultured Thiodictyon sp.]|uniref:hypothetical protein n=1 Tax=uncultured Thiodictyon sp. TaxID=1846217 RepID=UPI0025D0C859|nr:hypothetical protein [uncultured Thiodictyon sp.]
MTDKQAEPVPLNGDELAMMSRASATGRAPGFAGLRRGLPSRCGPALLALALAGGTAGCALGARSPLIGLAVSVTAPIAIPPQQAHAVLQDGRLANASNRLNSWCELEVRTLSGAEPQSIARGHFHVSRVSSRLLLDPTTRIPVSYGASSCSDPLFQEEVWWLSATEPSDVMYLRCIAPYYNCAFGLPLSPVQVQQQVGPYLTIRPNGLDHKVGH